MSHEIEHFKKYASEYNPITIGSIDGNPDQLSLLFVIIEICIIFIVRIYLQVQITYLTTERSRGLCALVTNPTSK